MTEAWEWVPFFKKRMLSIALVTLLTVAVTMGVTFVMPPSYTSTATLVVQPLTSGQPFGFPTSIVTAARNIGQLAKSPSVASRAASALGKVKLDGTTEFRVPEGSGLLLVIVTAHEPETAAAEANALANALIGLNSDAVSAGTAKAQLAIDDQLARLRVRIAKTKTDLAAARAKPGGVAAVTELQDTLDSLGTAYEGVLQASQLLPQSETALAASLMLADAAVAEPAPVSPKPVISLMLSLVGGLLLGIAYARATESSVKGHETGS